VVWGIGSALRRHWVEVAWGAFALANVVVILLLSHWNTIPFHLIWVSLTILYGFRVWSVRSTALLLAVVMLVTGAALTFAVGRAGEGFDEVAEVPLMAAMFLAMVWHARRRQAAVEEARRMAAIEHRLLERQRGFVRDASHELRTPITVARGHAELLRAASVDPQAILDADIVIDELARLSRLAERLLILAAAEDARFLDLRPLDVRELVEETGRRWGRAVERDWRLEPDASGEIVGDADRLREAVDALVENAIHATVRGGSVTIAGWARGDCFVLEVSDDGVGIDPTELPALFERFSRVDPPRTRRAGGTGLGLPIVKAIAEAHGGSVEAESELGRGATFRIVLPGFSPAHEPSAREPSSLAS
jgi:signal transduction histidine kinase